MARTFNFALFLMVLLSFSCMESTARASRPLLGGLSSSSTSLMARLKLDNDSTSCWESLIQLEACSAEIILFFVNGETYLGHGCCEAIRIITKHCWPAMINALGFTSEEGDILEGYCDKADDNDDSPTLLPPPPPPSLVPNNHRTIDHGINV